MILGHKLLGNGPAKVLALHGWLGDETFLDGVSAHLSLQEYTYCCVAYRGYGASRAMAGDYSLDEIAADADDVVRSLGWQQFAIVGHSMGAKVAQKILLRAPESVRGIVAIAPVPASEVPFDEEGWTLFTSAVRDTAKRSTVIDFSTGGRLTRNWVDGMAHRSVADTTTAAFEGYLDAWAKTDFSAAIDGSTVPLLVLIGANDPHLNEQVMRQTYLKCFRRGSLQVVENAGHYPMDETPIDLATRVEGFLAALL